MAQTFRSLTELEASFPDNTTGIISAESIRDLVISIVEGKGLLEATTNITLPITDGAWTLINPLLQGVVSTSTFWGIDGNNFLFPNQSNAANTIVPAGHKRLAQFLSILELEKTGGGADNYAVQFTLNGVGIGEPESVEFPEAGIQTVTLLHPSIVDISIPTDLYGVQIEGVGTAEDLTLGYFSMTVSDSILVSQP